MPRCPNCNKKCATPLMCKWCEHDYCFSCRSPETHKCINIAHVKSTKLALLKDTLDKQKTTAVKIEKI